MLTGSNVRRCQAQQATSIAVWRARNTLQVAISLSLQVCIWSKAGLLTRDTAVVDLPPGVDVNTLPPEKRWLRISA